MLPRWVSRGRSSWRQEELPFLRRSRRLEGAFKAAIVASTMLGLTGMLFGTSSGRGLVGRIPFAARKSVASYFGFPIDRAEIEAARHRERIAAIEPVRRALEQAAVDGGPTTREFLRVARLDSDSALIRWGNVDRMLALSSAVFEADETGRSYRLRPNTRSIWVTGMTIKRVLAMFEIPDTLEGRRLGGAVGGKVVPGSVQVTNSWGCRGPEPDPTAPVRVLVLGDSNMQGLLVGDQETPPARLEAALRRDLGVPVSILNTGHLGYSPEQYYHTLIAYFGRFRPQFVVISICANDFGDMSVNENWAEGEYWLDAITLHCRSRGVPFLVVPLPDPITFIGGRKETVYPGKVSAIFDGSGMEYLDPIEDFTSEYLTLRAASLREGKSPQYNPLLNQKYDDLHLSPVGCELWARIVARRLELVWQARIPGGLGPIRPGK